MKHATQRIIEEFPILEEKIDFKNVSCNRKVFEGLNETESTFLRLAYFFENPDEVSFDIGQLYRYLNNGWLELALELITEYFRKDTYLIQSPTYSLIKDGSEYYTNAQFADELTRRGLNYDRTKLHVYSERGKVPKWDLVVGGMKYWHKDTVQAYYEYERDRLLGFTDASGSGRTATKIEKIEMPSLTDWGLFQLKGLTNTYFRFNFEGDRPVLEDSYFVDSAANEEDKHQTMSRDSDLYKTVQQQLDAYFEEREKSEVREG
ncbi:hypothetical protein M3557_14630 [Bhargavaea ginsengi]|uniref:hypothetical protein n=1 Tax=Bhargavaea ginsengi TaxID=426757 RepID=UPI002040E18B|nr:hypothetical protein [Bhargavaea ginsengi]MCM3089152.1 hypothetical protein [Bhargavaea ginsengi]